MILDSARDVFATKGFEAVTMKDIAEAAGISRGGLYLYFTGTEDIFLEVLKKDAAEGDGTFESRIRDEKSAGQILRIFLDEQKKELVQGNGNLTRAQMEYAFSGRDQGALREKFDAAVQVIEYLLKLGMARGEFREVDPKLHAQHMMYVVEGMKITSQTMQLSEDEIEQEFDYMMDDLEFAQ